MARIFQLNIKTRTKEDLGVSKHPVLEAMLTEKGFEGDFNRYRTEKKNGSLDMAVLVLPFEQIMAYARWPVLPGNLGENITTIGILYNMLAEEQQYKVGEAIIELTFQAQPCKKLGILHYVGANLKDFMQELRNKRGWYAKVLQEGMVRKNDAFELV